MIGIWGANAKSRKGRCCGPDLGPAPSCSRPLSSGLTSLRLCPLSPGAGADLRANNVRREDLEKPGLLASLIKRHICSLLGSIGESLNNIFRTGNTHNWNTGNFPSAEVRNFQSPRHRPDFTHRILRFKFRSFVATMYTRCFITRSTRQSSA